MLDPFFELRQYVSTQARKPEPPQTITVDGVEYVRKEPALQYKVGDIVMFTGKIVAVDDDSLPYQVEIPHERRFWFRKEDIEG